MRVGFRGARTHIASGRFLCLALIVTAFAAGCQTVGGPVDGRPAPDARPETIVVGQGPITEAQRAEAERLWLDVEASFQARRFFEVARNAQDLLDRFPASPRSGSALRLLALAQLEVEAFAEADAAATRYLGLLGPDDPRADEMLMVQADARVTDPEGRLAALLQISGDSVGAVAQVVRDVADELDLDGLQRVIDDADPAAPFYPMLATRMAVTLLERDRQESARLYATRAIDGGAAGEDRAWAEGVLRGELPPGRGRVTDFHIGAVLPLSGPPALAEFSSQIVEGIEVAVTTVLGDEYTVTLDIRDDEGDPVRSTEHVLELEAEGVVGVVGFLLDDDLMAGASIRTTPLPLVSPTARSASRSGDAVYSLEGADPEAARSVARYAVSRAFQRIAMVYPETPEAAEEADAFQRTAESLGMPIAGRFTYPAGATFFEDPILRARDALRAAEIAALGLGPDDTLHVEMLEPVAVFFPIPPEDVEFLAPQVIHFGLDTLAIEVLGTSGWTDRAMLEVVDPRHTTGVVATVPLGTETGAAGRLRFRQAYEDHFQRSLVGSTPAVGYDATLLLLEALRPGRVGPTEVRRSFGTLREVQGATGVYSVLDDIIVRQTQVVRIDDRVPIPLEVR